MRKITEKKSKLNLVLNTLEPHDTDITLKKATFIILDFEKSGNNAIVDKDTALNSLGTTIINKPIRGYYKEDDEDFGGHEVEIKESKNGEVTIERNTIPMGVFTTNGYLGEVTIEGESREVLLADAVLWYSQFKEPIDLMVDWYEQGVTISMSCEYLYSNNEFIDGVEHQYAPMYFEAHCILGQDVTPAYESAKLVSYNQLKEFKQLVAQLATTNEVKGDKEVTMNISLNELSFDDMRVLIKKSLPKISNGYSYISEMYKDYIIVSEEIYNDDSYGYKYYRYDYTFDGESVTLDINSKKEVIEKKEWVILTEIKNDKIEEVTLALNTVTRELSEAKNESNQLKIEIDRLKDFEIQVNEIKRKEKFNELSEKFGKAFENAGAMESFNSEEVQTMLNNAVDNSEALLSLNMLVVELLTTAPKKEVKEPKEDVSALFGFNSIRKDLIKVSKSIDDEFEEIFKK